MSGDTRSLTYTQDRFQDAPVHLVYVADLDKMKGEEGAKMVLAGMDTGFIARERLSVLRIRGIAHWIQGDPR